jgi:transposase
MSDDVPFSALGDASLVRLGEIVMILELHRQGVSVSAIARRVELDRKTVRRYIAQVLEPPTYGPRQPRISQLQSFEPYLRQRLAAFPQLTGRRLHRELRELGYGGGYTILTDLLRKIRPNEVPPFEVRFETPPGRQAQVDFAHFRTVFTDEPGVERIIWLFVAQRNLIAVEFLVSQVQELEQSLVKRMRADLLVFSDRRPSIA